MQVHEAARAIFNEIGYFAQVNRDFASCFLDRQGKNGASDVMAGRLTWLIVVARQRADKDKREELLARYGTGNEDDAKWVSFSTLFSAF